MRNIFEVQDRRVAFSLPSMPLGSKHNVNWDGKIEKSEKKLAIWKSQQLSQGGRVALINSSMDSLPTYVMSFFPFPSKVVKSRCSKKKFPLAKK